MTLLITLVLVALVLFALFWGVSAVAQGYLYSEPVDKLPLRALAAALAVASFLALWVLIDRRAPGKYDTFFEFAPYTTAEYSEFDAVRWTTEPGGSGGKIKFKKGDDGKNAEKLTKYKRPAGNKAATFREDGTGAAFRLNDSQGMTAAIVFPGPEGGQPSRFNAVTKTDPRSGNVVYGPERRFNEEKGSRYLIGDQPGQVFVPSTGAVVGALALNLLHFVVWFLAIWLLLRFGWGHALGAAVALGLLTMLAIMPLLFKPNRVPKAAPAAEKAALVVPGERVA